MATKLFVATKAFIEHDGKILCLRESGSYVDGSNQGKYDVPGGRIEPGEPLPEALAREVREETGLTIARAQPFYALEWQVNKGEDTWHVVATCWRVVPTDVSVIQLSDDHDHYAWVDPTDKDFPLISNLRPALAAFANISQPSAVAA